MSAVIVAILLQIVSFVILLAIFNRRIRRELSGDRLLDDIRDEVNGLIVELNQTTDRNIGLVEERIRRLQELVNLSDKKIQLLNREIEKHQVGVDVYEKLKASSRRRTPQQAGLDLHIGAGNTGSEQTTEPPASQIRMPVATPSTGNDSGTGPSSLSGNESSPGVTTEAEEAESTSDRVIRLFNQGFDARVIAQKLGTTMGEVELILSLKRKRDGR